MKFRKHIVHTRICAHTHAHTQTSSFFSCAGGLLMEGGFLRNGSEGIGSFGILFFLLHYFNKVIRNNSYLFA